ncbi:TIR protein [Leptolyngbya boryana NIES-2135]|jgi:hypothetical protein|uniref:TIR protein n=1 Tax=Leptolyngbya boryana NIES-2135 TaxID=1973484 RepID=A0A1Z4JCH8_LEPBY|nr:MULTISPECIES: GUN4 domain-containing protein [Leptolyngbya]BAY54388.1 TIR protein [Leptolyngbya boryana NIES-2135]MBD2370103.1 GUN4 domain-containing protein [Leptolyngbya sp. FACHB-161]MBD2376430.1 GUN4 domain-containing protein [Leptolyngbya sp. FACHB-238]MBD2400704.1 GUN4 domain-containing protein [Leptolyngbya sp. FACHB-239]MBD2407247.1 GUN4 domain-containing protein [Leptolyngbya sp. FACHB-402]
MSISIFFSYSHKDEALRDKVAEHLSALKRSNVIQEWHDRLIPAGSEWKDEIDRNLRTADIILLLVSASFLSSDYCWSEELKRAMTRHETGEAVVIPVILCPCDWQDTPFAKLQMLPKDARAVTLWSNEDEALTDIAHGIRGTVQRVAERKQLETKASDQRTEPTLEAPEIPPAMQPSLEKQPEYDSLFDYMPLGKMLKAGKWKQADQETLRVMLQTMGRQREGWLRVEDVQKFPCLDLRMIDRLWLKYSDGRFGFSTQIKIWQECGSPTDYTQDWCTFSARVGWYMAEGFILYPNWVFIAPQGHFPSLAFKGTIWRWGMYSLAQRLASCGTQQL